MSGKFIVGSDYQGKVFIVVSEEVEEVNVLRGDTVHRFNLPEEFPKVREIPTTKPSTGLPPKR